MPVFEFRCSKCNNIFEILVMGDNDKAEMKCTNCGSENFERVMSAASFNMDSGNDGGTRPLVENRKCSGGTCSSVTLPGHSK